MHVEEHAIESAYKRALGSARTYTLGLFRDHASKQIDFVPSFKKWLFDRLQAALLCIRLLCFALACFALLCYALLG